MERSIKIKFYLDLVMSVTLLITAITGIINLINQLSENESNKFLGLVPDYWIAIHGFFAIITVILIIIHLFLHKDWIVFNSKKIFEKNNIEKSN